MKALALLPLFAATLAHASDPLPWLTPHGSGETEWVPVFVLGDEAPTYPVIDAEGQSTEGVMIGLAQVTRESAWLGPLPSTGTAMSWSMTDSLRFGASVTVTDFVPCRSLMQSPLAPIQSDPCTSFSASGVEAAASMSFGLGSLSLGISESPAIWVLPGQLPMGESLAASLPSLNLSDTTQSLFVSGELALSPMSSIGLSLARSEVALLENSPDLDRMQLRLAYGDFSADVATQMIRQGMDSLSPWWAGLDLGVSWRTPWSGVLSVGAQNLITKGQPPEFAQPVVNDREPDIFSRTPYVRYEQDF